MNTNIMEIDRETPPVAWLESATPLEILRWAVENYGSKLTMATAFGAEGCAILDMLAKIRDETGVFPDVFNLDTGYQFGQTLSLRKQFETKYGIPIRVITPDAGIEEAEARSKAEHGVPLYKSDPNECCYWRKVAPLPLALEGFDAWISAIRRDQTPERANVPIVSRDKTYPLIKINPLANWSKEQVWDYIRKNGVPTNPLHAQGFPSIGCWPCTKPVEQGQDERAGRWAGTEKRECGIHLPPSKPRQKVG
jgi:phosphoadenosine phosphosulfate reductase